MPAKKTSGRRTTANCATSPRAVKAALQRREAIEYRLQGHGYAEIGRQMGLSTTRAFELVEEALREVQAHGVDELRKLEGVRIDMMQAAIFSNAAEGDLNAIQAVLRLMERRARLFGLDAPEKRELTGKDGKDLPTPVLVDAETARNALADALARAGLMPGESEPDTKPTVQ